MRHLQENEKWELLAKYHAGEASQDEIDQLGELLESGSDEQLDFEESSVVWQSVNQPEVNVDAALENVLGQISEEEHRTKVVPMNESPTKVEEKDKSVSYFFKIAASVTLLLGVSIALYFSGVFEGEKLVTLQTNANQKKEVTLPDGTKVYLNENSTLNFSTTFNGKQRKVSLTGEAFFDVVRNESKPFVIDAGDATVKVLGTSFDVNTNNQNNEVEVIVKTGKVSLTGKKVADVNKNVILEAGYSGTVSKSMKTLSKNQNTNINYLSWKTGVMTFDNTDLKEVIRILNGFYETDIEVARGAAINCKYTATFEKQSFKDVIDVIGKTLSLDIRNDNGKYIIHGNCQ